MVSLDLHHYSILTIRITLKEPLFQNFRFIALSTGPEQILKAHNAGHNGFSAIMNLFCEEDKAEEVVREGGPILGYLTDSIWEALEREPLDDWHDVYHPER